uniref:Uncharacterized protein n=1 Tax=Anopheles stephensi TaxID=30069 RepID=A0A182XV57_ANOST
MNYHRRTLPIKKKTENGGLMEKPAGMQQHKKRKVVAFCVSVQCRKKGRINLAIDSTTKPGNQASQEVK